ncbi:MAG: hypothetical protein V1804_00870 [Patescibacteria group bacterium]
MSLDDLEKKLYDPDSGIEKRTHEESQFNPLSSSNSGLDSLKEEKQWSEQENVPGIDKKKFIKIGAIALGSIILVAAFIVGFVKYRQSAFKQERVSIKIEGLAQVNGFEKTAYKIIFKNDNRASLDNAKILLNYSENFRPDESQNLKIDNPSNSRIILGTIKGNSEGEIDIAGSFLAAKDSTVYINSTLEYTPSSFSIAFQSKSQFGVNIESSPLFLEVEAPLEAVDGNKIDYVVNYRNTSGEYFDGVRLKVEYPEGFSFISSNPSPSEGNIIWYLGSIAPNQDGKIVITGMINGSEQEEKVIKAYLGYASGNGYFVVYNQKEKLTKISSSPLFILQQIDEKADSNVDAGELLRYSIEYKNNGSIAMQDVVITEEIDSRVLDFSKLESGKGSYDASKKIIIWKASDIPALSSLAPGQGGKISFSVPILGRIPVGNINDSNFTVISTAKIDSPSIANPIGSNKTIASSTLNLKLNSRAVLEVKGYYNDSGIPNSGPIPPKVGQETSYTIHWKIINVSNNLSDVKVVSSLPSGVKWNGKFLPNDESLSFNERTNQVEWAIGNMKNGVGILEPAKEVSFQISVVPQVNQVGEELVLVNPSILTAKDVFTGVDIKSEVGQKDNNISEDTGANGKYRVEN